MRVTRALRPLRSAGTRWRRCAGGLSALCSLAACRGSIAQLLPQPLLLRLRHPALAICKHTGSCQDNEGGGIKARSGLHTAEHIGPPCAVFKGPSPRHIGPQCGEPATSPTVVIVIALLSSLSGLQVGLGLKALGQLHRLGSRKGGVGLGGDCGSVLGGAAPVLLGGSCGGPCRILGGAAGSGSGACRCWPGCRSASRSSRLLTSGARGGALLLGGAMGCALMLRVGSHGPGTLQWHEWNEDRACVRKGKKKDDTDEWSGYACHSLG